MAIIGRAIIKWHDSIQLPDVLVKPHLYVGIIGGSIRLAKDY